MMSVLFHAILKSIGVKLGEDLYKYAKRKYHDRKARDRTLTTWQDDELESGSEIMSRFLEQFHP